MVLSSCVRMESIAILIFSPSKPNIFSNYTNVSSVKVYFVTSRIVLLYAKSKRGQYFLPTINNVLL
jgi:hypothetical protein